MANKRLFTILSLLVVAVVAVFGIGLFAPLNITGLIAGGDEDISSKVENLYELINPGIDVKVEKIEEVSGMYKVLFRATDVAGGTTFREAYVTKDGELLTESVIFVSQSIDQISRVHDFVDCLEDRGLVIFGISNHTATALQFNVLGGTYATKLYRTCDGERAQQCVDAGITQVPATVYEGSGYPGVQSIAVFQNLTGCAL